VMGFFICGKDFRVQLTYMLFRLTKIS
jgi:hypothetical protein